MKKGLLIGSLAVLLVAGAGVAVVGVGSNGFKNWDTNTWFDDLKNNTDDSTTEEEVKFYSVEGSREAEIISNLKGDIEPKTLELKLNEREELYRKIIKNYNTVITNYTHDSGVWNHYCITSGDYQLNTRIKIGVPTGTSYYVIYDNIDNKYFDINDGLEFNESVNDLVLTRNNVIRRLFSDIEVTDFNYDTFDAINSAEVNSSELIIEQYDNGNFDFYFFKTTSNYYYYFLPNNLTYNLDITKYTDEESIPTYSDANFKEIASRFFKLD